jgi:hypothetical protein
MIRGAIIQDKKIKPPEGGSKQIILFQLGDHEATIQNSFVFTPKPGVTPLLEIVHFICYQNFDSLP